MMAGGRVARGSRSPPAARKTFYARRPTKDIVTTMMARATSGHCGKWQTHGYVNGVNGRCARFDLPGQRRLVRFLGGDDATAVASAT